MDSWERLSDAVLSGAEYTNAEIGWQNPETGDEVIVYRVEGTGMEEVTDKKWAVQHPPGKTDEHTHFFESLEDAKESAKQYVK